MFGDSLRSQLNKSLTVVDEGILILDWDGKYGNRSLLTDARCI